MEMAESLLPSSSICRLSRSDRDRKETTHLLTDRNTCWLPHLMSDMNTCWSPHLMIARNTCWSPHLMIDMNTCWLPNLMIDMNICWSLHPMTHMISNTIWLFWYPYHGPFCSQLDVGVSKFATTLVRLLCLWLGDRQALMSLQRCQLRWTETLSWPGVELFQMDYQCNRLLLQHLAT